MLGWDPRWDIIFSSDIRDFRTSLLVNGLVVLTATVVWSSFSFIPGTASGDVSGNWHFPTHSHSLENSPEGAGSYFLAYSQPLLWELNAGVVRQQVDLRRRWGHSLGHTQYSTCSWTDPLLKSMDLGSPFMKRWSSAADNISLALYSRVSVICHRSLEILLTLCFLK